MTGHEKEVALAAIALCLERAVMARDHSQVKEWRLIYKEVIAAPKFCEAP